MATKHQKIKISIPSDLDKTQRAVLAVQIVDYIIERSKKGLDKTGNPFPAYTGGNKKKGKYSKSYVDSVNFRSAGKSSSKVTMDLSGEMLDALEVLNIRNTGEIEIGYKNGSDENAKADGNIRGTYGNSRPVTEGRDFLGIESKKLKEFVNLFSGLKGKNKAEILSKADIDIQSTIEKNKKAFTNRKTGKVTDFDDIKLNLSLSELQALERKLGFDADE